MIPGFDRLAYLVQVVSAVFASLMWFFGRGSDLELWGQILFVLVGLSLAVRYGRTAQNRIIKSRRRTRRVLLKQRIALLAPLGDPSESEEIRIEGTVVYMDDTDRDEIIVRTDLLLSTTEGSRSDLLAITPVDSGESFSTLLDSGQMRVGIWLVNHVYLSARRGNPFALRSLRRNPTFSIGQGLVFFDGPQTNR